MMQHLIQRLKGLVSSSDFMEAERDLATERAEAASTLASLEARREQVLFSGDEAAHAKLEADIIEAERAIKTLDVAIEGAERRRVEAAAREHRAMVEERMAGAAKLRDEIENLYRRVHPIATELVGMIAELRKKRAQLQALNQFALSEGAGELVAELPVGAWVEAWRQYCVDASLEKQRGMGVESPRVPDNLKPGSGSPVEFLWPDDQTFRIPGYRINVSTGALETPWQAVVFADKPAPGGGFRAISGGRKSAGA